MDCQLLVTCCNCQVIMCSCDIRHSSADRWLLSACLQTDGSRKIGFGGPANIVIFNIENKFRATILQVLKACRRSGGTAPPTLQLSVRWRCVFSLTLMPFYTQWYRTGSWLDRQPGRTFWRGENLLFQPRIESGIVQPHEYLINVIASLSFFLFGAPWISHEGCKVKESTVMWLWLLVQMSLLV